MGKNILVIFCLLFEAIFVIAQSSPKKEWSDKKVNHTFSPPLHDYPFMGKELDYGILLGAANSLTDIGNGTQQITDIQILATNFSVGTYIRYRFARHFGVSATLNYGKITGSETMDHMKNSKNLKTIYLKWH